MTTLDATAWRTLYSDASGNITELALGTSGQHLKSNGASSAPTWETPATGGGLICAFSGELTADMTSLSDATTYDLSFAASRDPESGWSTDTYTVPAAYNGYHAYASGALAVYQSDGISLGSTMSIAINGTSIIEGNGWLSYVSGVTADEFIVIPLTYIGTLSTSQTVKWQGFCDVFSSGNQTFKSNWGAGAQTYGTLYVEAP